MDYYNEIKKELIENEIHKRVKDYSKNKYELEKYYNVGKLLIEAGKHYGEGIIKEYSKKLTKELGKGYSQRNLRNMRRFYKVFQKWQTVSANLTWSHYCEIIWFEKKKMYYYLKVVEEKSISVRKLREITRTREYERLPEKTKDNILNEETNNIYDYIKDPIVIQNKNNYEVISEKVLQKIILEDIESFMKELGNAFSFIGSEYKIKIGNRYNYIDLLLFNIEYNCYVVIELKVTELKKEHIGQIQIYMNYIDNHLKKINQDKTIGIIICKRDNKYVIEYSSDKRILSREYELI